MPAIPIPITAISWIVANSTPRSCSLPNDTDALSRLLSSLESSRSSLEFRFEVATLFVVIGVVIEVVVVLAEHWQSRAEYGEDRKIWEHGGVPSPHKPLLRDVLIELVGAVLVTVGVAGEFWYEERIGVTDTCVQQADNARASLLEKEAARADERATTADNELIRLRTPRSVSPAGRARILRELARFTDRPVVVAFVPSGFDSESIGNQLASTLATPKAAQRIKACPNCAESDNWQSPDSWTNTWGFAPPPVFVSGIEVMYKDARGKDLAEAIAGVLNRECLDSHARKSAAIQGPGSESEFDGTVIVHVGTIPPESWACPNSDKRKNSNPSANH